ncbi:MAG TPA: AmmeMemoRadiSam system protein A [Candidatus Polarisedimenticolia bacterium]|nr:AmmeMemoRadiSam system protein A [Candidatus Polarisedimenticolia bacterium]
MSHPDPPPPLTAADGRALLAVARGAILEALGQAAAAAPDPSAGREIHPVFVTVRVGGRLRGCIGRLDPETPLSRSVATCARAAAFEDPRFEPIGAGDLPGLTIEMSVLGPRRPLADLHGLRLGEEGLLVTSGGRSGLLLPQVAIEQGWDALEFLEQTCRKAGLARSAWREGARVEAFPAQVFREEP